MQADITWEYTEPQNNSINVQLAKVRGRLDTIAISAVKIDWNFIALLIGIVAGIFSISSTLWKIANLLTAKDKAQDRRTSALYEIMKMHAVTLEDIIDFLARDPQNRGKFYPRKSSKKLEESAFREYEDERTGFND